MNILETRGITKRFGGLLATDHVNLSLREGELRCIIGPNGAGKTTLFNLITGHLEADAGAVLFQGEDISESPVHQRVRLGIGRKFQSPAVFDEMNVLDNVRVSARGKDSPFSLLFRRFRDFPEEAVEDLLEKVHLADKACLPASKLSHGDRQWLEIAMVLANGPRVLLLDEPTAGMTPAETIETALLLKEIASEVSTVVIEHDLKFVRELASRITVLHKGAVLAEGTVAEISRNDEVRKVYLGREEL
jgi:urea transport system ATP-binding protein